MPARKEAVLTRNDLSTVAYRLRCILDRRLGAYIAMALLVGVVGGTAMGSLMAARRTQSSFATYLVSTNPSDLTINEFSDGPSTGLAFSQAGEAKVAHLPGVKHVEAGVVVNMLPLLASGAPRVDETTLQSVFAMTSVDGLFFSQDRLVATEGRMARSARPDEVVMTALAARLLNVHVGQMIRYGLYTARQESMPGFGTPRVSPARSVEVKLVGLVQMDTDLVEDDIDRLPTLEFFTPAFFRDDVLSMGAPVEEDITYGVQLERGSVDLAEVERSFARTVPLGATYEFHLTSPVAAKVDLSVKPLAIALGVFGFVAALAALVIGSQVLSRQRRDLEEDQTVLRALGASRAAIMAEGLVGELAAVVCGSLLAVVVAVGLSPLSPIGPVRPVYPGPWVAFDWTVLGGGLVVLVAVLSAVAFGFAYRGAPDRIARQARLAQVRPSRVANAAASAGLPVAATVGTIFALEPGRGRTAVPVRGALLGGVLAVSLVVATLTFGSGLRQLVSHPALYGWDWSYMFDPSNEVPPQALALLDKDPRVAAWTGYSYDDALLDGVEVPFLFQGAGRPGQAPISPPVLSGHGLEGKSQIVLGAATMAELHKHIGDAVFFSYGSPSDGPFYVAPERVTIVGTATMPAVGFVSFVADHTSMGTGALLSEAAIPPAFQKATSSPYPTLNGPDLVFVRLKGGVSASAGRANLQQVAEAADRALAAVPNGAGEGQDVTVVGVQRPAQIVNYRSMGSAPLVLSGAVAGGALVAFALTLATSVGRRRRDLAVLRTLGFTDGQLASAVACQASIWAALGAVFGGAIGVAVGRWLWVLFARQVYAVPEASVPVLAVTVAALATLALSNFMALWPARAAARTSAGLLLRSE